MTDKLKWPSDVFDAVANGRVTKQAFIRWAEHLSQGRLVDVSATPEHRTEVQASGGKESAHYKPRDDAERERQHHEWIVNGAEPPAPVDVTAISSEGTVRFRQ